MPTRREFTILALLILVVYSNTFNAPWQLDDPPNITQNYPLHIDNLMPETLWQTLHAKPFHPGTLFRPLPNLTFAINWYIGEDNPLGYHIVNLFIHILTSIVLFKTIQLLYRTPALRHCSHRQAQFTALLASTLWALNPIQTQAITYIVQRMASLAGLFFLCSIYYYLHARLTKNNRQRILHFFLCIFFYICALFSKENTAILPFSLLLAEFIFFAKTDDDLSKKARRTLLLVSGFIIIGSVYYVFQRGYFSTSIFEHAETRPFSPYERLLTEPGILLFYLSLIFYPLAQRFSIDHDVTIIHSLLDSWVPSVSIAIILTLVLLAIRLKEKQPLLCFAILFFFINQLIESTLIPLELIFEHRNYIPTLFLFIPIAAGLFHLLNNYSQHGRFIYLAIMIFITSIITLFGWNTYQRNSVWATEESLWEDALTKAPDNARPLAKLGELAGWNIQKSPEHLAQAVTYYQKALTAHSPRTSFEAAIYGNIGEVFFLYGFYDKAIENYEKSLELTPHFNNSEYGLAKTLAVKGKFDKALQEVAKSLKENEYQPRFFNLGGLILLWQNRPAEALLSIRRAMQLSHNKQPYFYNIGVALSKAGHYQQASWFLGRSKSSSYNLRVLFSLLENSIRADNTQERHRRAEEICQNYSVKAIKKGLQGYNHDYFGVPIDIDLITPVISKKLKEVTKQLANKPKH